MVLLPSKEGRGCVFKVSLSTPLEMTMENRTLRVEHRT